MKRAYLLLSILTCLLLSIFISCQPRKHKHDDKDKQYDLQQIKDSGELVALTLYSSTSFFIYRGQDMGFQFGVLPCVGVPSKVNASCFVASCPST